MNGNLRRSRAGGLAALAALAALAGGCGGPETATVSGRVTFAGKPVTSGSVIVYCSDKQIVRGNIGADGTYTIPNVPRGSLAVTVQSHARVPVGMRFQQSLPPATGGPTPPTVSADDPACVALPPRYAVPEESGLSVRVERGPVTFDIDLKP